MFGTSHFTCYMLFLICYLLVSDLSVDMPDVIDITPLRGNGQQANEELLPERQAESGVS